MRDWNELEYANGNVPDVVCSLPMRDWNMAKTFLEVNEIQSVAYLWGIETRPSSLVPPPGGASVAYLWGIETKE